MMDFDKALEYAPTDEDFGVEARACKRAAEAVKYADEWESYDYENLYFTREEAEAALEKRRDRNE